MYRTIPIAILVLTAVLVAYATISGNNEAAPAKTADGAVQSLYAQAKNRNFKGAYRYVSSSSNIDDQTFIRDLNGRDGSLRTYSSLQDVKTRILKENGNEGLVRTTVEWSTAIGAIHDTRDLKVINEGGDWKVEWPVTKQPKVPPQVVPVNYLRWDIVNRGGDDEWGAQNAEAPRVSVISMNAVERDGSTIIMGEVANQDTVPAFVTVNAALVGKDGNTIAEESSFDKVSHTLLPKEISPFRIDFPKVKMSSLKSVTMQPKSLLVPASADPVIGVLNQKVDKDLAGRPILKGELINQSGQTVNIPHVIATYYNSEGKVVWVSDAYLDQALLPLTPVPFSVGLQPDVAKNVQNYRVTVNEYSLDRTQ